MSPNNFWSSQTLGEETVILVLMCSLDWTLNFALLCSNLCSNLSVFSALFYMLRMKFWKMFCWLDHFLFFFKCYNYLKSLHIERQLTEYFTEINSFCPLLKFDYCFCCLGSPTASRKYFGWKKWLRFCRNLQRRREQVRRRPESRFQSELATETIVDCGANVGNLCCKFFWSNL